MVAHLEEERKRSGKQIQIMMWLTWIFQGTEQRSGNVFLKLPSLCLSIPNKTIDTFSYAKKGNTDACGTLIFSV